VSEHCSILEFKIETPSGNLAGEPKHNASFPVTYDSITTYNALCHELSYYTNCRSPSGRSGPSYVTPDQSFISSDTRNTTATLDQGTFIPMC
jgi:hypothetical protein